MPVRSLSHYSAPLLLMLSLWYSNGEAALPATVAGQSLPTLAPMVERVTSSVVNIATRSRVPVENPLLSDPFFWRFFNVPQQYRQVQGLGSGVVIDADHGYLVTNHHVIARAEDIQVTLHGGRQLEAKVIGSDPKVDVAVIKVNADRLTAAKIADSDRLRVGDFVVAIGNPFGLGQTVTSGIVSALGRRGLGIEAFENFIQTDASINPGNSGGALVNLRGELVGINTAIMGPNGGNIGIGFAIPVNLVRAVATQLIKYGKVRRGVLGVVTQDLSPILAAAFDLGRSQGVIITRVKAGSPAARAGLRPGDVIVSFNGHRIENSADMRNIVGLLTVGTKVRMEILRDGHKRMAEAVIAGMKTQTVQGRALDPRLAGCVLSNIEESSLRYGKIAGVRVAKVQAGSSASCANLRPGDLILSINRQPVENLRDARRVLRGDPNPLLLNVQRGQTHLFILFQ
jgi:Do/DeqQ family serine protease